MAPHLDDLIEHTEYHLFSGLNTEFTEIYNIPWLNRPHYKVGLPGITNSSSCTLGVL